jgi:hypothetical protein
MLRHHGHPTSDRAIILHYFVKDAKNGSLEVEFTAHIDPVKLDLALLESKFKAIVKLLNGPYPGDDPDCEDCAYYVGRLNAKTT